jgi:peptidoglycan hydrolase CwlO-like protein
MNKLLEIFTVVLLFLLIYFIINYNLCNKIQEGVDNYSSYDTNNPNNAMILAQKNAGNISALHSQINNMKKTAKNSQTGPNGKNINEEIKDLSNNITSLQTQVHQLVVSQQHAANNISGGGKPVKISGTS